MKVTVNNKEPKEDFPKLLQSTKNSETIILAIGKSKDIGRIKGCIVSQNDQWNLGEYSDEWCEEYFILFEGSITLSND